MNRRGLLKFGLGAGGVAVGVATLGAAGLAAAAPEDEPAAPQDKSYTETYQGRQITITQAATYGEHVEGVFIDGVRLHVMTVEGVGIVSAVNHYKPASNVLDAARLAVESLRGRKLQA